jgi:hypothetical protein
MSLTIDYCIMCEQDCDAVKLNKYDLCSYCAEFRCYGCEKEITTESDSYADFESRIYCEVCYEEHIGIEKDHVKCDYCYKMNTKEEICLVKEIPAHICVSCKHNKEKEESKDDE